MIRVHEVWDALEAKIPSALQESYDNCGLQVGDPLAVATGVLCCVDVTETVIREAIERGANVIIAHHPLLFKGLKRIGTSSYIERCVRLALQHGISIYAAHTSADNAPEGLNYLLARDLGLQRVRVLEPSPNLLVELVTFVPRAHTEAVSAALWEAGAGRLGAYDSCSYRSQGEGTFRALDGAQPFVGQVGTLHREQEDRLSVVLPAYLEGRVEEALLRSHPYETPAYSFVALRNQDRTTGSGIIGDLPEPQPLRTFLAEVESYFETRQLRYSVTKKETVSRIALCGGAGAFLWRKARALGADIFITGEAKYNDYFDCEGSPVLVTVGHYESEKIASRLLAEIISAKIANFAVYQSELDSNPIIAL